MKPPISPWSPEESLQRADDLTGVMRREVIVLKVTQPEVRTLVGGAGLLGVRTTSLLAWAGTVNPEEATLPRWRRPYVTDAQLIRYVAALDVGALEVARQLARQFGIGVDSYLLARSFHWLRRIRSVHLEDPRWERLDIPVGRVAWTKENPEGGPSLA